MALEECRLVRRPSRLAAVRALVTGRSFSEEVFRSRALLAGVRALAREVRPDVAVGYSSTTAQYLDGLSCPRVMDLVDFDSLKWEERAGRGPAGLPWRVEARRLRSRERRILAEYDRVTVASDREAEAWPEPGRRPEVLPNGVDTERYSPGPPGEVDPRAVVFTGVMNYPPNVEGVVWFSRRVLPRIREAVPGATFTIVGSTPVRRVRRLAAFPGVTVTGRVPEVAPRLRRAAVAVAPLGLARGVQNKVLQAMACGVPVVATPAAAAGIRARPGRDLLTAETETGFAEAVTALLLDPARRAALGRAARERVAACHRWAPVMERMESILAEVAG